MAENLLVGSHGFSHKNQRKNHDRTFKHDTDFICYKCWHKWDWLEIDLVECACPECGAVSTRRRVVCR